jgi:methionine sulfoxide reductase heme-binding subunit
MKKGYLYIGLFLFFCYLIQGVFDLRWNYLWQLQLNESFKRWSGAGLFIFIAMQWLLTLFRVRKWEATAMKAMKVHRWMGAFSPLVFYIHSMEAGFGYLMMLTFTFFANMLLGFFHVTVVKVKANWYLQGWMIFHVAFSLFVSMLAIYHIWIVFYYQ